MRCCIWYIAFIPSCGKCKSAIIIDLKWLHCIAYWICMHLNRMCTYCASCNIILRRKANTISNGSIYVLSIELCSCSCYSFWTVGFGFFICIEYAFAPQCVWLCMQVEKMRMHCFQLRVFQVDKIGHCEHDKMRRDMYASIARLTSKNTDAYRMFFDIFSNSTKHFQQTE